MNRIRRTLINTCLLAIALAIAAAVHCTSMTLTGVGSGSSGSGPTTVYNNPTIAGTDGGITTGISMRIGVAVGFASGSGGQVRVTLKTASNASSGVQGIKCDHVSVGVAATAPNTAATPVEVKFGGVSGVTLDTAGASATSDFSAVSSISWLNTDTLVVVCDQNTGETWIASSGGTATVGAFGPVFWKAATTSWNVATVSGFNALGSIGDAVVSVETQ